MASGHEITSVMENRLSRRRLLILGSAALGSLAGSSLLAACGDDDDDDDGGTDAATATTGAGPAATPASTGATPPAAGATATSPSGGTASTPAAPAGDKPTGGTIVQSETNDADNLDPHRYYTTLANDVMIGVVEQVIQLNPDLELEPILLDSIEVTDDGLIYTMHVREGITFHNGDPLDAEAIKFSHERANNDLAAYPGQFYGATWEVVDPLTVNMIMPEANSGVMLILAFTGCGIVPPAAVAEMNDDMSQHPIGTGPFKFVEWIAGDRVRLEAFEDYKNPWPWLDNPGRPHVDELVIRVIPEEQTQIAELETGGLHIIPRMPSQQVANFEGNDDFYLIRNEQSTTTTYLAPVMVEQSDGTWDWIPPFTEQAVRQAVGWAINVDEIIDGVLGGLAIRNRSTQPTGNPGYSEKYQEMGFNYDPEKARELLEGVGWVEGSDGVREKDSEKLSIVFWTEAGATRERVGQLVQNYLQEVGFEVEFQAIESATMLAQMRSGDCHLIHDQYGWNDPDIVWWLGGDGSVPSGYYIEINPEFDEIAQGGWAATDLAERGEIYYEASKIMVEDGAMIPLWNPVFVDGVRAELKDFKQGAQGRRFYNDAYFEES
jgi:peptide/nickel transport system substrate-binding protein